MFLLVIIFIKHTLWNPVYFSGFNGSPQATQRCWCCSHCSSPHILFQLQYSFHWANTGFSTNNQVKACCLHRTLTPFNLNFQLALPHITLFVTIKDYQKPPNFLEKRHLLWPILLLSGVKIARSYCLQILMKWLKAGAFNRAGDISQAQEGVRKFLSKLGIFKARLL